MAKKFYTERDIEDLSNQGTMTLTVGDDVVLTDLAYEKAKRLGVKLVQPNEKPPGAPQRPYLNQVEQTTGFRSISSTQTMDTSSSSSKLDLVKARVRDAVKAKLGSSIDEKLLDTVIERVAKDLGLT